MAKILTRARKLRLDYASKLGRPVTAKEVADATGIHENSLNKIENGKTRGIEFETLAALCTYYGVSVGDILEFDPNGIRMPELAPS